MPANLDQLQATFQGQGPAAMLERLIADLKEIKDYQSLFYALLMKRRHELGLTPIATGNNSDVPADKLEAFEDGIRHASRTVGQLFLDDGKLSQAWPYFRMIGEPGPVKNVLENTILNPDDDPRRK